jgi:hypothetical protein
MSLRYCFLGLMAIALASGQGCCCLLCWPYGKTWCGSQCGDLIWNEWFSLPPDCCDPCNNCGAFTGPNNRFLRRGVYSVHSVWDVADGYPGYSGGGYGGYFDDPYLGGYNQGSGGPSRPEPIQSRPPAQSQPLPTPEAMPLDELPSVEEPGPSEELPLSEPSAALTYDEFGRVISYDEPIDSRPASRTLGRPPQSRVLHR